MEKEDLEELLTSVVRADASALHLAASHRPSMRMKGRLVRSEEEPVTGRSLDLLAREFLFEDHREQLEAGREVEFLYCSQSGIRFRTVVMRQARGLCMTFHRIPTTIPGFAELYLPQLLAGFASLNSGLVVITGFLGSGKSTTLASMVDFINKNSTQHMVLIESPIEYIHEPEQCLVYQREVGFHVGSFATGVREACRTGADVIVVSEVRNAETLDAILDATEKGVLVLTTIHASSVVGGMAELQGFYDADDRPRMRARLARSLRIMMAQTLLSQIHDRGKVPLLEVLIKSASIGRIIRGGQFQDLTAAMTKHRGLGSQTVDLGLRDLLSRHLISEEEALYHAVDREVVLARHLSLPKAN